MADTKISNLPAVAAPADGDEFPCNQGGTTKKETRGQIVATVAGVAVGNTAAIAAHIAVTTAPIHGSSAAAGANTLAHRNAAGDLAATDFNAVAGTAANPSHTFTVDPDTGLYRFGADELGIATGGAHRAHWNTTGALILNDAAASSKMTGPGVTIQQGAYDDEIVALQSSDVGHGATNIADTDTYGSMKKRTATAGGLRISGLKDAGSTQAALVLSGYLAANVDTTKDATGRAIVEIEGFQTSGVDVANTVADGNVFAVRTYRGGAHVTLLLVDEDGDLWLDGTLTANEIANRTRKFLCMAVGDISAPAVQSDPGVPLEDGVQDSAVAHWWVPSDFVSDMSVEAIVIVPTTGTARIRLRIDYEAIGEDWQNHTDDTGWVNQALVKGAPGAALRVGLTQILANEAIGDCLHFWFSRDGGDVGDVMADYLYLVGFLVTYTADS